MIRKLSALRVERLRTINVSLFRRTVQFVSCYKEITHSVSHGHELDIERERKKNAHDANHKFLLCVERFFFENPSSFCLLFCDHALQ